MTALAFTMVALLSGRDGAKVKLADITVSGDTLFYDRDGQGKQALVPLSETVFSLSGTPVEFITDAQGAVTELQLHEVEGETKGMRKK